MEIENLSTEVEKKLKLYNVVWDSPSKDSSGSMPIGNGDITANVWAESDGTLSFYIGKSDTWSEATRLLKLGKVKVQTFPNFFGAKSAFCQILHLKESEILIRAGREARGITLRIWVDANHPAIRLEAEGAENFEIRLTNEVWRKISQESWEEKENMPANNWNFFHSPLATPAESADVILEKEDGIGWYHRNETSPYREMLIYQNAGEFFQEEEDPYKKRTFGGYIKGAGVIKENPVTLWGRDRKRYAFSIYTHTAITDTVEDWENELLSIMEADKMIWIRHVASTGNGGKVSGIEAGCL